MQRKVLPRSFADTNGEGSGDLNGITRHLDYIKDLGIDAIWISPVYPSPQVDFGYDISDYTAIDPQYGTMADFDRLMAEARKRDIRVILDLVLNHTCDGKPNHQPPNNWISIFGHSAWQFDEKCGQYYYHENISTSTGAIRKFGKCVYG